MGEIHRAVLPVGCPGASLRDIGEHRSAILAPYKANQKAVLLSGEGDNGKSTYLSAVLAFLGSSNATNMSLHRLEADRFSMAKLVGKLANICPDLPSSHLNDTSIFKALTGDEAQLTAEYKHKDSFEFEPFAKLVFSANHPPRSSDASHAFFRRWVVAPFERTFTEEERIPRETLDAKLAAGKELSGALNKMLEVLPRVRTQGFTESEKMRRAWEEFRQTTDPISVWLDKNTVVGPDAWVSKTALLSTYNNDAANNGRMMTMTGFTQAMHRLRPDLRISQKTVNGKVGRVWLGIGLKGSGPDDGGGGSPHQGPGAYYGDDPPEASRLSQLSQLSSNCNEKAEGQKAEEESPTSCNKRKVVKPVNPVEPTVRAAVDALRYGNGPRKVLDNIYEGTQGIQDLARSVMVYYGAKQPERWEEWLEPVAEAFDQLTSEDDVPEGGVA